MGIDACFYFRCRDVDGAFKKLEQHLGHPPAPDLSLHVPDTDGLGGMFWRSKDKNSPAHIAAVAKMFTQGDDWAAEARRTLMTRELERTAAQALPNVLDLIEWSTFVRWRSCQEDAGVGEALLQKVRAYAEVLGSSAVLCLPDSISLEDQISAEGPDVLSEGWLPPNELTPVIAFAGD